MSFNESSFPEQVNEVAELLVRVYEIHEVIIVEAGGLPGLRDAALLHAAVARPFATFAGAELYPSDFEKAVALFHSLIKSHPFKEQHLLFGLWAWPNYVGEALLRLVSYSKKPTAWRRKPTAGE